MAKNTRRIIESLLDQYEPVIKAAFLASINEIRSRAEVGRIADMLERGDIEGALKAVHLDPASFRLVDDAIGQAYNAGGIASVNSMPGLRDREGSRLVIRFDARNPRAESWLKDHSSNLVTRIVEDQRQAIRTALTEGMIAGNNPRITALDIVGRINRQTGRREGGTIGLTSQQERFVANARRELLSGDPSLLRAYMERTRRDKRFDRSVLKAIQDETGLYRSTVDKMIGRYKDSLLQLRGETIARTEAMASLHQAQDEAFRQAVDAGGVARQDVRRIWRSAGDARVRDSHAALNGESVGLDEPFANGLMYPGDPMGDVAEVANCRCTLDIRIDFLANIR